MKSPSEREGGLAILITKNRFDPFQKISEYEEMMMGEIK